MSNARQRRHDARRDRVREAAHFANDPDIRRGKLTISNFAEIADAVTAQRKAREAARPRPPVKAGPKAPRSWQYSLAIYGVAGAAIGAAIFFAASSLPDGIKWPPAGNVAAAKAAR